MLFDLARFSRLPTISRQARVVPDPILGDIGKNSYRSEDNTILKHHCKGCNRIQKKGPSQSIKILE
jgi:hypothetical protein